MIASGLISLGVPDYNLTFGPVTGELNVVDGDDNERNRSNALGEVMHPNAHLNPLVSYCRHASVCIHMF